MTVLFASRAGGDFQVLAVFNVKGNNQFVRKY